MKLTMEAAPLRALSGMANSIAPANSSVPIHACVHLSARDGEGSTKPSRLVVQAFDGDLHYQAAADCTVHTPGEALVPAALLHALASKLGAAPITLEIVGSFLWVQSGRSRNRLALHPLDAFPDLGLKVKAKTKAHVMGVPPLLAMLKGVGSACSKEEKAITSSLRLEAVPGQEGRLRGMATDGYRGALAYFDGTLNEEGINLTSRMRAVLPKFADRKDTPTLKVSTDGKVVIFQTDNAQLTCRGIAGNFPPVPSLVVHEDTDSMVIVSVDALRQAIARALLVCKDPSQANRLELSAGGEDVLRIQASSQAGMADEEVEARWVGAPFEIPVNGEQLDAALATFDGQVVLGLNPKKPGFPLHLNPWKPKGDEDPDEGERDVDTTHLVLGLAKKGA